MGATAAIFAALALMLPTTLLAQPAVTALIPVVMPDVEQARKAVADHPRLATFEIEGMLREALDAASTAFTGLQSGEPVRAALRPLESDLGPVKTLPYVPLQTLLGAPAGAEGRADDQFYRRAFAVAVLIAIDRSGDGRTLPTAMRVVMVSEQYTWFGAQRDLQRKTRRQLRQDGRVHDVWMAATSAGDREVFFDATASFASAGRVLDARRRRQTPPRQDGIRSRARSCA
jgi:hypothetical protein